MKNRTTTGAGLIALLLFALYMGGWVFAVLYMAAVCLALFEMFRALSAAGHRPVQWPTWLCMIGSIPYFLLSTNAVLFPLITITCMTVSAIVIFRSNPKLEDVLVSLMPLFGVAMPGMCLLGLLHVAPRTLQTVLLSCAFFIPVMGDMMAYFVGTRIGKVKLNPAVSPKKTVEGAIAGLAASLIAALAIYGIGRIYSSVLPPLWHFVVIGIAGGLVGQLGDLFASLIKRHCNVKDYGAIFPGHGGMMDRLDSILFTAVMIYMYQTIVNGI
jgi:phosphatidate cytidylyltransferase